MKERMVEWISYEAVMHMRKAFERWLQKEKNRVVGKLTRQIQVYKDCWKNRQIKFKRKGKYR